MDVKNTFDFIAHVTWLDAPKIMWQKMPKGVVDVDSKTHAFLTLACAADLLGNDY